MVLESLEKAIVEQAVAEKYIDANNRLQVDDFLNYIRGSLRDYPNTLLTEKAKKRKTANYNALGLIRDQLVDEILGYCKNLPNEKKVRITVRDILRDVKGVRLLTHNNPLSLSVYLVILRKEKRLNIEYDRQTRTYNLSKITI